ncbi:GntR family transcriptional regulator [Tepidibacter hydrothermalis]|uniref:GntR family transcriptional regulator n=1 Tax=Tepidibacter hydrothermalis TaxID=3036126 RepID=A0ABY8E9B9_9FIRM|nr:GntR family transcriptional regulator [Tepidibacter hydrothermalis]WFD09518.1 GntR family transcriptional regulator [Tepidibacter hydrothermalis]
MININSRSSKPIYEQIIDGIKENIMKKILRPNDKIPSVRELASMITANPNTVSRAYKELERQGFIVSIKGRGTYVADDYEPDVDYQKMKKIKGQIKNIIIDMHHMGIGESELIEIIKEVYLEIDKG